MRSIVINKKNIDQILVISFKYLNSLYEKKYDIAYPKKINLKNPNVLEKELIRFIEKYNDIIEI